MRKLYFLLLVFLPGLFGAQWVQQTSGTLDDLKDVYAGNANIAWAVGTNGAVQKTLNGGVTWTTASFTNFVAFQSVQFLADNTTGFVSTDVPDIRKTINGGVSWSVLTTGTALGLIDILDVKFFNASTGIAGGRDGTNTAKIVYTLNGGTTWSSLTADLGYRVVKIDFGSDANTAYAIAWNGAANNTKVYKLVNGGGGSYNLTTSLTLIGKQFRSLDMISSSEGYISGTESPVIYKTSDGGSSWIPQTGLDNGGDASYISAFDATHVINVSGLGYVNYSINGGVTWQNNNIGVVGFRSIYAYDNATVYAVGNGGIIYKNSTILPVTLSSFTAQTQNRKVLLNWSASTELNNKGFAVMRKTPTENEWQQVGYINSKGNSNQVQNYSFIDEPKGGTEFLYQLKQSDIDGKFSFSNIIKAKLVVDKTELSSYPNPVKGATTISYSLKETTQVQLLLRNVSGQFVQTLVNQKQTAGNYSLTLYSQKLSAGTYYAELIAGKEKKTVRLSIIN